MNSTPPAASGKPSRLALPAGLLVCGIALSCSTACITSAIIGSASDQIASAKIRREMREKISQTIEPLLPQTESGPRKFEITDEIYPRRITLTGRFGPGASERFFSATRALYGPVLSFDNAVVAQLFDSSKSPPTLASSLTLNPVVDLAARLRLLLPPTTKEKGESSVYVHAIGQRKVSIIARGDFSSEQAREFAANAAKFQEEFSSTPDMVIFVYAPQRQGEPQKLIGRFDFPPQVRP